MVKALGLLSISFDAVSIFTNSVERLIGVAQLVYDFMQSEAKPRPMLIGRGILPRQGKAVLGGAPKSNKSFIALNMAFSMARGEHIFKAHSIDGVPLMPVKEKLKVLYLEQEIGIEGLKTRLGGIIGGELDPALELFIKSKDLAMRLDTPEGRKLIEEEIAQVNPDVTIFDPLTKFHLLDENSAQHMGAIMKAGDKFIEKYGTALIYIHHTGKEDPDPDRARRGGNRLRGSSAVFADVDTLLLIDRQGPSNTKEPTIKIEFEVRQGEPIDPIHVRRTRTGVCEYLGKKPLPAPALVNDSEVSFVPKQFGGM